MIAREWKARCPLAHKQGFINHLYQTGVKETSETVGFQGAQILTRDLEFSVEITLISYWENLEQITAFAGDDISIARLYPEDDKYELDPDHFVTHYQVVESRWVGETKS